MTAARMHATTPANSGVISYLIGAAVCLLGVVVIMYVPRGT
jgi:drug/metabolite transporter superfamily protein YnfA